MTATAIKTQTEPTASGHLPELETEWQLIGPIRTAPTRERDRYAVHVEVATLLPEGLGETANAATQSALDVSATVAADPRVVEATAKRDRLAASLERDRAAAKHLRLEADRFAAAARAALVNGDDPAGLEAQRDESVQAAARLGTRVGELAELLTGAERELETAVQAAERASRLAIKRAFEARLAEVSKRLSQALSENLAELWLTQGVVDSLSNVR